jgi:hypothetical protein
MTKTHVYLLVPKYSGVTGTIQAAYDFASGVNPNGPIQFHLVDYDENNPKYRMERDEGFDGMSDIDPSASFSAPPPLASMVRESRNESLYYARKQRQWLETPEEVLQRMADAEDWFFETHRVDRENSLVILLNPYGNYNNYFYGPSPERKNVAFIQTTHYATEVTTARHIPVAYEFFASALRFRAFNVPDYQDRFVHFEDRGCLNDFFESIEHIQFKIQSANVCDECYDHILEQNINQEFLDHLYDGLNAIRELQVNFTRARRANKPLTVTTRNKYVIFEETQGQVRLPPKQMTMYKFFLNHPEGVEYKDFVDHKEELRQLYAECYTGDPDAFEETRDSVIGNWLLQTDISSTVSKINKALKKELRALAHWHVIDGPRGMKKGIKALTV